MKKILFQGDSITDAGRSRDNDSWRGNGYPTLVAARLGYDFPNEYEFLNRGISGNRIVDLYARLKSDVLNLKPDIMSILIGVNDVWHEFSVGNGVSCSKFEKIYDMLISEILEELPDIRIIIFEPYVLKGTATEENWETFKSEVELRAKAAKRIAEKYDLLFVPTQKLFDDAVKSAPADYWTADGVHPTAMGHEVIARAWIEEFKKI